MSRNVNFLSLNIQKYWPKQVQIHYRLSGNNNWLSGTSFNPKTHEKQTFEWHVIANRIGQAAIFEVFYKSNWIQAYNSWWCCRKNTILDRQKQIIQYGSGSKCASQSVVLSTMTNLSINTLSEVCCFCQ